MFDALIVHSQDIECGPEGCDLDVYWWLRSVEREAITLKEEAFQTWLAREGSPKDLLHPVQWVTKESFEGWEPFGLLFSS